jgi:2-amino-4-hydroxy-6-hydroxymethyldihydropteridine diphosphokinase
MERFKGNNPMEETAPGIGNPSKGFSISFSVIGISNLRWRTEFSFTAVTESLLEKLDAIPINRKTPSKQKIINATREPRHEAKNALKKFIRQKLGCKITERLSVKKHLHYLSAKMKSGKVILLLGSNLGNRKGTLKKASGLIQKRIGAVLLQSSYYESEPWGKTDQPDFLNQALVVETKLSPQATLTAALSIERELGRIRSEKWGSRTIDVDVLYVEDQIINSDSLIVPHPGIAQRRFVLEPLAEIVPHFIHPILNKNQKQLLDECKDPLKVKKI